MLLAVNTTVTTSLFDNEALVYVVASVPTSAPFNFHWYAGVVPPFVGVAVKVTLVPEQILLSASFDAIDTAGVTLLFTDVVMLFPLAVDDDWQVLLAVSTTVTTSLFDNEALVYVVASVPTLVPFNFHWYAGVVPPSIGVAVNVTLVPEQILLSASSEVTVTDGVTLLITDVVMLFPLAVADD